MKAVLALAKLDISRHRIWQLKLRVDSALAVSGIYVSLVLLGLFIMSQRPSYSLLFPLAAVVVASGTLTIAFIGVMMLAHPVEREWWLAYPHPRRTLIFAKFVAHAWIGLRAFILTFLAAATVALLTLPIYGPHLQDADAGLQYAFASALLALVCVPVCASVGTAFILFTAGWARIGNILFGLIFGAGGGFSGAYLGGDRHEFVTTGFLLDSTAWVVLGGGLLSVIAMWFAPTGVRRLGNAHLRALGSPALSSDGLEESMPRLDVRHHEGWRLNHSRHRGAWPLFLYEMSRFRWWSRQASMPLRVGVLLAGVIMLAAGIVIPFWRDALISVPVAWMLMTSMFGPLMVMNLTNWDFSKGLAFWWMTFPVSRVRLLLVRLMAEFLVAFGVSVAGLLLMSLGVAIHGAFEPIPSSWWILAWPFFWRVLLVLSLVSPAVMFMLLVSPALYRGARVILLIPMYLVGMNGPNIFITKWIMPDDLSSGPLPHFWLHLVGVLTVLTPLAAVALFAGAKSLPNMTYVKMLNRSK